MNKLILPFVETMITQTCNLGCAGCTNYSDLKHSGYVTWEQGKQQLLPWRNRVEILDFGIIGGEPLINPQAKQWISGIREMFPLAQIRFTTNGLLLSKNLDIIDLAAEIGNIVFKIGVHVTDAELENNIDYILQKFKWEPVVEYGIRRYKTSNDFRFQISRPDIFWKTFKNDYASMEPHDSNPANAFEICCQKTCPLLYQGKIYKCSTSGLLKDVLNRFGNPNYNKWKPFLVEGIAPDCSSNELEMFIENFGKPHSICKQCPESTNSESKILHKLNVVRK